MAKNTSARPQDGQHTILVPIIYRKPNHALTGKLVKPEDKQQLDFAHLDDAAYELLIGKKVIAPITPSVTSTTVS